MKKQEKFFVRALKGLGFWLIGEVMCLIICLMASLMMNQFYIMKIVMSVCTLVVTLGMFFQYSFSAAKHDKDMVRYHGQKVDKFMPIKMAGVATAPIFLMLIVIFLVKVGVIDDLLYTREYTYTTTVSETVNPEINETTIATTVADGGEIVTAQTEAPVEVEVTAEAELRIFNVYLIANIHVLPFISMFTELRTIEALSWGGFFGLLFLELLSPLTIILTYYCTYNDIDVKKMLIYKNSK